MKSRVLVSTLSLLLFVSYSSRAFCSMEDNPYRGKMEKISEAGRLGGEEGSRMLVNYLRDRDLRVRTAAVSRIVSIGEPAIPTLIDNLGDEEVRWLVSGALINIGKPSVKHLVLAIKEDNPAVRRNALFVLRQLGAVEAAPSIERCLYDPDLSVRVQAIYTVAKLGGEGALRLITGKLNSNDIQVRSAAIESMSFFGEEAIPHLANVLKREKALGKVSAIKSLGLIGSKKSITFILVALEDSSPGVRYQACVTLGELDDSSVLPDLVKCFNDPVPSVREAANEAVSNMADRASPLLSGIFKDGTDLEKINAASVVRKAKFESFSSTMVLLLKDPSTEVRIASVSSLIELEDPETVEPLVNSLLDDDVRWFSIIALRRFGQTRIKVLLRKTDDPELDYWKQYVLSGMGDKVLEGCVESLKEKDMGIRISSICTLKQIKSTRAVYPLIKLLGDDKLGDLVSYVVAQMGEVAVEPLLVSLNDENPHVRARAASALGIVGLERVVNPLKALLSDSSPEVRRSAERAIERIYSGTPEDIMEKVYRKRKGGLE